MDREQMVGKDNLSPRCRNCATRNAGANEMGSRFGTVPQRDSISAERADRMAYRRDYCSQSLPKV